MESWENLGCTALIQQLLHGQGIDDQHPLRCEMLRLAGDECQRVGVQLAPADVVDAVLRELARLARRRPRITRRVRGWLSQHNDPLWIMFAIALPEVMLRLRWRAAGYADLDHSEVWDFVATPEFEQFARPVVTQVMDHLHRHYSTTSLLDAVLLRMPQGGRLEPKGFDSVDRWLDRCHHPLWLLFVMQLAREIWRRKREEDRDPVVVLPSLGQGSPLAPTRSLTDDEKAAFTRRISESIQEELNRIVEEYRTIFMRVVLPAIQDERLMHLNADDLHRAYPNIQPARAEEILHDLEEWIENVVHKMSRQDQE